MADPNTPTPAPTTSAEVDAAETKAREASAEHQKQTSQRDASVSAATTYDPATRRAVAEEKLGGLQRRSSNLVSNPAPAEAPVVEQPPEALPQSTIDEMEAGRKALERNKPVALALEEARNRSADDKINRASGDVNAKTTAPSNPVDATNRLQQNAKV